MASGTPAKESFNMDVNPPPAYRGKDRTRMYVVAITVIVVALLVGFFGVFYLLLSSPAGSVVNTVTNEVEAAEPVVIERGVSYEMGDDVEHYETMTAEGDILTIKSVGDGFFAVFDHGRNIIMVKSMTTGVCYFTRLENFPEMNMDDMDNMNPFYFREINGTAPAPTDPNVELFMFVQSDPIAPDYVALTNSEVVGDQCTEGPSYWVTPKEGGMRQRRLTIRFRIWCFHVEITITRAE